MHDGVAGEHIDIVNLVMFESNERNVGLGSFNNSTNQHFKSSTSKRNKAIVSCRSSDHSNI